MFCEEVFSATDFEEFLKANKILELETKIDVINNLVLAQPAQDKQSHNEKNKRLKQLTMEFNYLLNGDPFGHKQPDITPEELVKNMQ